MNIHVGAEYTKFQQHFHNALINPRTDKSVIQSLGQEFFILA